MGNLLKMNERFIIYELISLGQRENQCYVRAVGRRGMGQMSRNKSREQVEGKCLETGLEIGWKANV